LKYWDVDARPSDAIAMAVRSMIPIFVDEEVMNIGSYDPEKGDKESIKDTMKSITDELDSLKDELKKAVENEEYEKAAELRDRIKKFESGS